VAERQASTLVDRASSPSGEELYEIAAECRDGQPSERLHALREKLYQAIDSQAARLRREIHEQSYHVQEALMAAGRERGAERGGQTP
jgi:hypothetical protein